MRKLITISGVLLSLVTSAHASVPYFGSLSDRRYLDTRVAIGKTSYKALDLLGKDSSTLGTLFGKSTDTNSMVYLGYRLPIALIAAASNTEVQGNNSKTYLQTLLDGTDDMIMPFETSLGWTALHEAALNSNENSLKNILALRNDNRLDVNRQNREGNTALMVALKAGNYEAAKKILELWKDELDLETPNKRGETPALLVAMSKDGLGTNFSEFLKLFTSTRGLDESATSDWNWDSVSSIKNQSNQHVVLTPSVAIPQLSAWDSTQKKATRFWYNGSEYAVDRIDDLLNSVVGTKGNLPNAKAILGFRYPAIVFAACCPKKDALEAILNNTNTSVTAETVLRYNAAHAAAINSSACLKLIVDDGRIDINRRTISGESPLFFAAKHYGENWISTPDNNENPVRILLKAKDINVNSEDYLGRTIFHIAVMKGEATVVKVVLSDNFQQILEGGQITTTTCTNCGNDLVCDECGTQVPVISTQDPIKLDYTKPDAYGQTAISYVWQITDGQKRLDVMKAIEDSNKMDKLTFELASKNYDAIKKQYDEIIPGLIATASAENLTAKEEIAQALNGMSTAIDSITATDKGLSEADLKATGSDSSVWTMAKNVATARKGIQDQIAAVRELMKVDTTYTTPETEKAFIDLEITLRKIVEAMVF